LQIISQPRLDYRGIRTHYRSIRLFLPAIFRFKPGKRFPNSLAIRSAEFAGSMLTPVPGANYVRGARLAKAALRGAMAGAMEPVEDPEEGYWGGKAAQAAVGAVAAPAMEGVVRAGARMAGKAINAARGKLPEEAAELIDAAEQHGIRDLTYGDITGKPTVQKAEVQTEYIPVVGMSRVRERQQADIKAAAERLRSQAEQQFAGTKPSGFDDVMRAAEAGDQSAQDLVLRLQAAGDDPARVLQASIGLSNWRTREVARQLYDNVQKLVETHKLGNVPLTNTEAVVAEALAEAQKSKLPNDHLIRILSRIHKNIRPAPKGGPIDMGMLDVHGRPIMREAPVKEVDNSYGAIRQLRSDLDDEIRLYMSGDNALIGQKGVRQLERVRNALEKDLYDVAAKSKVPEIEVAARAADSYYKSNRVRFKDAMLAEAATTTEPDQIFQRFIKAGKGDRAQKFYDALDARGRAAIRYEMIAKAVTDATDPKSGVLSPQKFFTSMNKLDDAYGVFFKGAEKAEIDGFKKLMGHVTRAGQYAENPPTGQRAIHAIVGGGAIAALANPASAKIAASTALVTGLFRLAMTKPWARNFLLAASDLKPGSPAMDIVLSRASARIANEALSAGQIVPDVATEQTEPRELPPPYRLARE
ncbi:MAG: hypothetical protein GXX84_11755, partial [Acidobacteria bacterium]|nr:hypothetical protein [Acidobacteriota bacterium]